MYLRTLGHPALLDADGSAVYKLRKKDLALLVYLCVEATAVHSRGRLASLLWGESAEDAARHSLTQALGRLGRVLPSGSLVAENQVVRWEGGLPCDAAMLLRGGLEAADVDDGFSLYEGEFLRGFHPGPGAEEFTEWADGRRAGLRTAAIRLLEHAGEEAEKERQWRRAARLAERAVQIDPVAEHAHRRLMRALAASGERNRALRHYQDLADWLAREMGGEPDPDTRALAEQLRAQPADPPRAAAPVPTPAPPPPEPPRPASGPASPAPPPAPAPAPEQPEPEAGPSAGIPALPADDAAADEAEAGPSAGIPALPADDAANDEAAAPPEAPPEPAQTPPAAPPAGAEAAAPPPSARKRAGWLVGVGLLAAVLLVGFWMGAGRPPDPVRHGETVRQRGDGGVYLAFAETLYAYPDSATLRACTGVRTPAVREVRRLPAWPRRRLPSVREHAWMGGTVPVVSDHPATRPAYVAVGCILARVPDPPTLDSIFGPGALERMTEAPDPVLRAMPRAFIARGHPVRRAGTLVRGPDGGMRWVTYHGGALAVADSGMLARWCRTPREAVDVSAAEYGYYRPFGWLPARRGECRRRGE